jgi:dTDP-glucose pyrophosphorylase
MKGVVLAAGDGKRISGYHDFASKVLIEIDGQPLIMLNMERISPYVDSFVVVVGKAKKEIVSKVGYVYDDKPVYYVEQEVRDGPLGALRCAYDLIKNDDCIIVLADEYIIGDRIRQTVEIFNRRYPDAILGVIPDSKKEDIAQTYSIEYLSDNYGNPHKGDCVKRLVEKPKTFPNSIRGTGYYFVSEYVIRKIPHVKARKNGQYEITDLFSYVLKGGGTIITRTIAEKAYNINSIEVLNELIG